MKIKLLVLPFLLCISCVTIPSQAPQLSEELGAQISGLEKSHLALLHAYFDQKRALVDQFVNEVWVPEFTNTFFSTPEVAEAWDQIVSSKDTGERMEFFVVVGPQLQSVINEKRLELMTPLNELEQAIEASIREEYNLAYSANNTLTSFLSTASKIDENRSRYLKMLNISEEKISSVIDDTDKALSNLIKKSEELLSKEEDLKKYQAQAKEYLDKLSELKEKIQKK